MSAHTITTPEGEPCDMQSRQDTSIETLEDIALDEPTPVNSELEAISEADGELSSRSSPSCAPAASERPVVVLPAAPNIATSPTTVKKPHHSVPRQNSLVRCMIEHNLPRFTSHDFDKTVLIEKRGGARLGLTLSPTGVNAVVPSVVVASLAEGSPAAGKVVPGDQILSVNGQSLVGLPFDEVLVVFTGCSMGREVKLEIVGTSDVVSVTLTKTTTATSLGMEILRDKVVSVREGSLAEQNGIKKGSHLLEINGKSTASMSQSQIVKQLSESDVCVLKIVSAVLFDAMYSNKAKTVV